MKDMSFLMRVPLGGHLGDARNGAAVLRRAGHPALRVIFSDGGGWDHVSVTLFIPRCPTWEEMCYVKEMFFADDEEAIQFHPPRSDYINVHPYCLHLWRWQGTRDPSLRPPMEFVG